MVVEEPPDQAAAAVHLQLTRGLGLQLADGGRDVSGQDSRVRPLRVGERGRCDVLGPRVQRPADRVVALVRPPGAGSPGAGKDLVGPPAEQEGVGALVDVAEESLGLVVEQRQSPSTALESAAAVLIRAAESLHHSVHGDVGDGGQLHDRWSSRWFVVLRFDRTAAPISSFAAESVRHHGAMAADPDAYTTRPLSPDTWDDFAALVDANNGVWGGCWCMGFHVEGLSNARSAADNRSAKQAHVRNGTVHQILVYAGDECVGWCQYGSPAELPNIKNPGAYAKELGELPDWRIGCIFTGSRHRGTGVARAAVTAALDAIRTAGGGVVEAYPEQVEARAPQRGAYFHTGPGDLVRGVRLHPRPPDRQVALGHAPEAGRLTGRNRPDGTCRCPMRRRGTVPGRLCGESAVRRPVLRRRDGCLHHPSLAGPDRRPARDAARCSPRRGVPVRHQ